jgi:hypothetical protein
MSRYTGQDHRIRVIRHFQDGPCVFTQAEGSILGQNVFFDVFRFEGGAVVERWAFRTGPHPPTPAVTHRMTVRSKPRPIRTPLYIKQIPFEIEEAALVDGASQSAILRHIVLPLLMPGVVAASLLSGMLAWNEFLFALTLTRSAAKTAPVGISEFTNMYGTQWGSLTAAATVTVAPILLATMILRRRLVEGMTFGAVK